MCLIKIPSRFVDQRDRILRILAGAQEMGKVENERALVEV